MRKLSLPSKLLILCAMLAFATTAHALSITPISGTIDISRWEYSDGPAQPAIVSWAEGIIGADGDFLYKADVGGGSPEGQLSGSYTTLFNDTPDDPSAATITYNGGLFVGPIAYLLVKDGAHTPNAYLFNLTDILGWNGKETLELSGFWLKDGKGAISNVSLYGTKVPEPGTILLLGAGLIGLVAVSRRKFIK